MFSLHFFLFYTKHALYNIVLLYHFIIYSFNLKLWSIDELDPIVPCILMLVSNL